MIDRHRLLADLKPLLKEVEADLRARCDEVPRIDADLKKEYAEALGASRTGATYEEWRADLITQVGVSWVLSCVFVRFLEDNALLTPPRISGRIYGAQAGHGLDRARDEWDQYLQTTSDPTHRGYLLQTFDELAALPATKDVFGRHNTLCQYRDWLSGDGARKLIECFQKIDADGTGEIIHDFTEEAGGTQAVGWGRRYLGDLYQDLSELARKKYALLQTPVFIEEFILDHTLEPAIDAFGLEGFKMIDPACGSGHFLLGGFARLLKHWRKQDVAASHRQHVRRALASLYGVDLNPYAIIVTRFRLLLAVMQEYGITKLKEAPAIEFNLACGDSLLHGERPFTGGVQGTLDPEDPNTQHVYAIEDRPRLVEFLRHGQYHAVVANPPYITVKDAQQGANIRARYSSCHMKYALTVPFMERIFDLAVQGTAENGYQGGFTGQITSNSFMKREFGKKLIESYIPRWDLTHVIDTAGAYVPGHGTPTVILFGRNRSPVAPTIRTVMGITGEPATPADPAKGLVWSAIVAQVDLPGSQSLYVSVADTARTSFHQHPWSIGGGGAAELKELLDEVGQKLGDAVSVVGIFGMTNADEAMLAAPADFRRRRVEREMFRELVVGDQVRDWTVERGDQVLFPYRDEEVVPIETQSGLHHWLWPCRTVMGNRATFGKLTYFAEGRPWWEWHQVCLERLRTPLSITFGEVATHNHFVLDRGGKVFKQTAPVIKLPTASTLDDHFGLLGLLNSSVTCFWLKQVCQNKGSTVDQHGARQRTAAFEDFYQFNGTKLHQFPLPEHPPHDLAKTLDQVAVAYAANLPNTVCRMAVPHEMTLAEAWHFSEKMRGQMIAVQEELDWECYRLYGLLPDSPRHAQPPAVYLGQRAFEIVLARRMAVGDEETTWFARHGSTPITEIPAKWPEDYKEVVRRRIEIIETNANIRLIERPEYKRRWNSEPWAEMQEGALRSWLLDRLEGYFDLDGRLKVGVPCAYTQPALTSTGKLADAVRRDGDFMRVAALYAERMDFDVAALVSELVGKECVPALPVLRYKPAALDKRAAWERTWQLQRDEDRLNEQLASQEVKLTEAQSAKQPVALIQSKIVELKSKLPTIPVPPKYTSADFLSSDFWRLRGKLDVPKERWVSFPHCEGEDSTLAIAWAGYDHLQLARAIAERYELAKENEGLKLVPLLAAIGELIPWLKQWHNELDPAFGTRMGDYFEGYLAEEAKALGQSVEQVMAWTPPAKVKKTARKTIPMGAGGFPDNDRDLLLIAAGLSLVGPNGIAEDLHLDALILMTAPERCRAITSDTRTFDSTIKAISKEFWTDTTVKWKQIRELLRQAKAIDVDVHSGQFSRKDPAFTKLRVQYGKALDDLSRIALEAAQTIQTATDDVQREQQAARRREKGAA